jgi:C4-dicarboxylate transporter DctQ subunit
LLIVSGVTARYFFNFGIPFAIEYSEYMVIVIVLWGAAIVMKEDGHVNVDIVISLLKGRPKKWVLLSGLLVGLVYLIVVDIYFFKFALSNIRLHETSLYPTRTEIGYVQLFMPLGLSLFAFQLLVEIVRRSVDLYRDYQGSQGSLKE